MNNFDIIINAIDKASSVLQGIGRNGSDVGNKVESGSNRASSALGKIEGAGGKAASALGNVSKIAGGFVLAQGIMAAPGALNAISSGAVSLQQNAQKATIVLGESLGMVQQWASESAANMGLTNREATTLAAGMADLLKPMGFTSEQAAKMSTDVLDLSGALAEWSGGQYDAAGVADLLQDALLGETDGLKALGISLNAEEIAMRAATLTGEEYKDMTDAQKQALATQQLILEKSTDAQTAYASSQDDAASKQARATARMNEAKETLMLQLAPAVAAGIEGFTIFASIIATVVVPALSAIISAIISFVSYIAPLASIIGDNIVPILIALAPALLAVGAAILTSVVPALYAKTQALWQSVAAWIAANTAMLPIIAVALAIGVAIAALYLAWNSNFLGIRDITQSVIGFIRPYIEGAINGIRSVFETVLPILRTTFETVFNAIRTVVETVFPIIETVIRTYIDIYRTIFETGFNVIRTVVETVFDAIMAVFNRVFPIIQGVVQTYIDIYGTIFRVGFDVIRTIVETVLNAIVGIFNTIFPTIQGVVQNVISTIQSIIDTGINTAKTIIETVLGAIRTLFDTVFVPIQGVVENVWNTIVSLTDTAWNGYTGIYGTIQSAINAVKAVISEVLGEIEGIWNSVWGRLGGFVDGVISGVRSAVSSVIDAVNGAISSINNAFSFSLPGVNMPDPIPDIPGVTVDMPDIPQVPNPFGSGRRNVGDPFTTGGGVNQLNNGGMGPNALTTGTNNTGVPGGPGQGNTGGGGTSGGPGSRPGAIAPPDDGFYYDRPPNAAPTPEPVIGEPASGYVWPSGHFANPQNVGGGKTMGVYREDGTLVGYVVPDATAASMTSSAPGGPSGSAYGNNKGMDDFIGRNQQKFELVLPGKTVGLDKATLLLHPEKLDEHLNSNDPRVRRWAENLKARLDSGEIRDRNPESLKPLLDFFKRIYGPDGRGQPGAGSGQPCTGNTYNIYGMQVGDVQREIERAERRLATNWSVTNGG